MSKFRWLAVMAALIIAVPSLAPSSADARAGGGGGSGSRGSKSGQAPAPTQTAPTSKPVERSATPQQQSAQNPANASPASGMAQPGGFMARNPFLSGLMGGMLGAGLIGMMFGGGFGAGLGGMSGMLGLMLQLALIGGLAYLAVRLWRARSAGPAAAAGAASATSYAGAGRNPGALMQGLSSPTRTPSIGAALFGGAAAGGAVGSGASMPLAIVAEDYAAFEALLGDIQGAYGKGDLARLRSLVTPEMLGYFSEELSGNASRGVENRLEAVKLEQGDLSEAWSEAGLDYATVAMRFSMIDYMRNVDDGRISSGSEHDRTEATEVWTFLRGRGGKWILSAIQQT